MDCLISQPAQNLIIAATTGAVIAWVGNYHVQDRIHRHLRRTEELRQAFYEYLELVTLYWTDEGSDKTKRRILEAKLIVTQRVIMSEYTLLGKRNKKVRKSLEETSGLRMDLWDSATGGCFQQENWEPDLDRVKSAATAVTRIASSLH